MRGRGRALLLRRWRLDGLVLESAFGDPGEDDLVVRIAWASERDIRVPVRRFFSAGHSEHQAVGPTSLGRTNNGSQLLLIS